MDYVSELWKIQIESTDIHEKILPLNKRLSELEELKTKLESEQFIEINSITKEDVEMSLGDNKTYFGTIMDFIDWLRKNSNKNWAEWNTVIYRTSDLFANRMPDSKGRTKHLK